MSFWDKLKPAAPAAPAAIHMDVTRDGKGLRLHWEDGKRTAATARVSSARGRAAQTADGRPERIVSG